MKNLLLLFVVLLLSAPGFSFVPGHKITVQIEGLSDGPVLLAYHFGERQFIQDTAKVIGPGIFVFEGPRRLNPGIFLIVSPQQEFFELIIDINQHFSVQTRTGAFQTETQFEGSPENEAFFAYMLYISGAGTQLNALNQELAAEGLTEDARRNIAARIEMLNREIAARQNNYMQQFPDCIFSTVLAAQRDPQMPQEPIKGPDGKVDQLAMYLMFKSQYWNNIDFTDPRILQTPVYHHRLHRYFSSVVMQVPDSLIVAADQLLERARINRELFRYTLWFVTSHFERSQIMGHDAVFVHLVDKYYLTGEADWVTPETILQLRQRIDGLRSLLIGKVAPDMNMFLPDRQRIALHDVQAQFTIVYFWDSECVHCVRFTPQLRDMVKQFSPEKVQVFAVNIESDMQLWLNAVELYQIGSWINVNDTGNITGYREAYNLFSVPTVYLLDSQKRIVAKMVTVEQIQEILNSKL